MKRRLIPCKVCGRVDDNHLMDKKHQKRQLTPLTIIPVEGEDYTLQVPVGECQYWSEVIARWLGDNWTGLHCADETPNLPFLGLIALPSDDLAREWLIDQHATEAANG